MKRFNVSKQTVLLFLVAVMGVTSVLMNQLAGFRPFYTEGAAGVWRAISFSTIAISWIPLLISDILADRFSKKIAISIPAFIFLFQGIIWAGAILAGSTSESWQNLWAGMLGNYMGLFANVFVFLTLKKIIGTKEWYTLATVAIVSTVFGQFADNLFYMAFSPFQWAGNVLEGGNLVGFGTAWRSVANWEAGGRLSVIGWDGFFLKSAFEIGIEALVYPLTLLVIRQIEKLPEYISNDGTATIQ